MEKIFLVEDDKAIARNLILLLNSENFKVIHVSTQKEALNAFYGNQFDLALIDISLPDGNGFIVYKELKDIQNIPVIFLTAFDDESSVVTGLTLGADDYITKPFRPRELIARIKTALRKNMSIESIFKIQNLNINTTNGIVKKNGEEVFLSALEYRLLLVFINNPKSIITRTRLIDELWEVSGEFITDNTLTVYIKRLRNKIEDNPKKPEIILTVRGRGYRLGEIYV